MKIQIRQAKNNYSPFEEISQFFLIYRELEAGALNACRIHGTTPPPSLGLNLGEDLGNELGPGPLEDNLCKEAHHWHHCPEVHKAIDGVRFIADHTRREEDSTRVSGEEQGEERLFSHNNV